MVWVNDRWLPTNYNSTNIDVYVPTLFYILKFNQLRKQSYLVETVLFQDGQEQIFVENVQIVWHLEAVDVETSGREKMWWRLLCLHLPIKSRSSNSRRPSKANFHKVRAFFKSLKAQWTNTSTERKLLFTVDKLEICAWQQSHRRRRMAPKKLDARVGAKRYFLHHQGVYYYIFGNYET
jgi:hypothetical protein